MGSVNGVDKVLLLSSPNLDCKGRVISALPFLFISFGNPQLLKQATTAGRCTHQERFGKTQSRKFHLVLRCFPKKAHNAIFRLVLNRKFITALKLEDSICKVNFLGNASVILLDFTII